MQRAVQGSFHKTALLQKRVRELVRGGAPLIETREQNPIRIAFLEMERGLIELIPASDHLLLENLAVAPAHQRKGLGRRLMARVEALARASGVKLVRLYTNKEFASNLSFYRKLGYTIEREEPIKGGGTLVHFVKVMKQP